MNAKELQTPVVTSSKFSKKPSVVKKAKPKKPSWRQHWKIITAVPINAIVIILLFFGIKRHYKEKLRMANPNQLRIENGNLKSQLQDATTKIEGQAAEKPSETDEGSIRLKAENNKLKSQLEILEIKVVDYTQQQAKSELSNEELKPSQLREKVERLNIFFVEIIA